MASSSERCPDCGVDAEQFHTTGCDIEQCPYCVRQLISFGMATFFAAHLFFLARTTSRW
jgi:hypothetical protein